AVLPGPVIGTRDTQESDAIVSETRQHRLGRKTHHAPVCEHAYGRPLLRGGGSAAWLWYPGLCRLDLDVVGKRDRVLDVRALLIHLPVNRCKFRNVGGVEACHVDHCGAVRSVRGYVEYCNDGSVAARLHCAIDRQRGIGHDRKRRRSKYHVIPGALPSEGALAELVTAVSSEWVVRVDRGRACVPTHQQHIAIQLLRWNLEVQRVANAVGLEQSVARLRVLCNDLSVRLDRNVRPASSARICSRRVGRRCSRRRSNARRWHARGKDERGQKLGQYSSARRS